MISKRYVNIAKLGNWPVLVALLSQCLFGHLVSNGGCYAIG